MLSAIIITKNEQNNIKQCLESIKGVVDEIILVDSYSRDKTIEIARKYTNKFFFKKFENDFSKQRNFALSKTKGNWILSIDADETLSRSLQRVITRLIKNTKYLGYLIPRRNYINQKDWLKHGLFYPDYQLRLFKKRGVKYVKKVHEYPDINEKHVARISEYLIHNSSRTKYDSFFSILRLGQFAQIEAENLLFQKKTPLFYIFKGLQTCIEYFFSSFIIGKGFLDGFNGFRAAFIFSLFPLISSIYAVLMKYKITKYKKWKNDA